MKVSYNKLWKLLIDKNMKKMDLLEAVEMSPNTLAKLGRNEDVSMDVLKRICAHLRCDVGDIMEMIPEKDEEQSIEKK
jgi:DNA-binding Xre family transcriptional regulator